MKQIPLTQGKYALVDDEDYEYLNQWKWQAYTSKTRQTYYATRTDRTNIKRTVFMHKEILNSDKEVDHIDGNGLNNQKSNLREAEHFQNVFNQRRRITNTSGFKGVIKRTKWYGNKPWRARISVKGKRIDLGCYTTAEEAALVYDQKAKELYGEFANLNFKENKYVISNNIR